MINDDTFTALATIWDGRTREVFAAQDRHMDRLDNAMDAVVQGIMTQADGKASARRSVRLYRDRRAVLDTSTAQAISHELELWLLA